MNELEQARKEIDSIDQQMADLYQRRLQCVESVLRYKQEHGLAILDSGREQVVLEKNVKYIQNRDQVPFYEDFMRMVMANSRKYQQHLKSLDVVCYAGVKGAFAHLVCERFFVGNPKLNVSSFEEVFQAVCDKRAQFGVIPFENTNSGLVGEVLDLLREYPVYITGVLDQSIDQCLLGLPDATLKDIETVYSKDQALAQARSFIKELGAMPMAYPNTAMAAQYVASQNDVSKAAIGAKENAELYGLKVLASHIEGSSSNTTRFLVISQTPNESGSRFSVCLSTEHKSGALARIIEIVASHGLNMESIQSRPIKTRPFEYFFFIEMDGDVSQENVKQALDQMASVCTEIKVMGTYDVKKGDE